MLTYRELIQTAQTELEELNAGYMARLFMLELTREAGVDLYLVEDKPALEAIKNQYLNGIKRLLKNEPMAYVLGYSWFYGRKFNIDERVLIPRSETEQLVGEALIEIEDHFLSFQDLVVFDVGTGSGAIALSIALEEPSLKVFGSDISEDAINVALSNKINLKANVDFLLGDLLKPFIEKGLAADVIICNPPYIDHKEIIEESVYDYEPHVALFGITSNFYYYEKLLEDVSLVIKDKGLIIFEIGYQMRQGLEKLTKHYLPKAKFKTILDYQGKDRIFVIYL